MENFDIGQLEYLHDAIVKEISFTYSDTSKNLRITTACDDDSGCFDWCGKTVIVTFLNVVRASGTLLGHVAGYDMVQSFSEGASADMKRSFQQLSGIGIAAPRVIVKLCLHSGSEVEIACDEISVRVEG